MYIVYTFCMCVCIWICPYIDVCVCMCVSQDDHSRVKLQNVTGQGSDYINANYMPVSWSYFV